MIVIPSGTRSRSRDRTSVLRDRRVTGERPVRSTSPEEIVSLITGEFGDEPPASITLTERPA